MQVKHPVARLALIPSYGSCLGVCARARLENTNLSHWVDRVTYARWNINQIK